MATVEERRALLAVPCPWCGAGPGVVCYVNTGHRSDTQEGQRRTQRAPIHTLDGGCHDKRWQAALGRPAAVMVEALAELQPRRVREPVTAGADRPW